ncbi:CehA/McbA family metallohydrolase [Thermopirellula anaerolimosa]
MDRRTFIALSGTVAARAAFGARESLGAEAPAAATPLLNPFVQEGRWFKAAFHVHTTTSDGDVDVPTRLSQYREAGYQVVAVTDHWKTNDLSGFGREDFLPIVGMEMHPRTGTGGPAHHFVALNIPHPFELDRNLPAQEMIDRVIAAGGRVVYAHPYWTAHNINEMLEVTGYVAVEVFNSGCEVENENGNSSVHWDQVLNAGRIVGGIGTDDLHNSRLINLGWTMIKAPSLDVAAIMDAVERGAYYASAGPTIDDCRIEDGAVRIVTSPVRKVIFRYDGWGNGYVVRAGKDAPLTTAQWKFAGARRQYRWVRVEVVDEAGNHAWTNPMAIPSA